MKSVLVLGAGLVARPMVRYLLETAGYKVTVASRTVAKAVELVGDHPNGKAVALQVEDTEALGKLVAAHDLSVSLLPYIHHVRVAELCLAHGKHLVTTSYVSPAMRELDGQARAKGLLFLNEIGLDPGIDHMSAMRVIHKVQAEGGRIASFKSYCGGLPAPDANDNPLGYKLSWSPRGVAMAGRNEARFRRNGEEVVIPGARLFASAASFDVPGEGPFEAYPNRNSLPYLETYGIQDADHMVRGTLRNPGWCRTWQAIADMGYLKDDALPAGVSTYAELTAKLLGTDGDVRTATAEHCGLAGDEATLDRLAWLDLFDNEPLPADCPSHLDALCDRMQAKMGYAPGERDMVVLHHEFIAAYDDGSEQLITSTFVDYGVPGGDSAMARTVSLPAAIAIQMLLDGELAMTGVQIPIDPVLYVPVLAKLEGMGLACREVFGPRQAAPVLAST